MPNGASVDRKILSVTDLTGLIRQCLEDQFADLWVEGEISNLRRPGSGHLYLTLKDDCSQLRTVIFRSGAQRLRFALTEGLAVIARGHLSVYEPRGEYQFIVDYLEPKGLGAWQLAFDQLKAKLERERIFDSARKRPLPLVPKAVGIVTSVASAALRDMLTVLHRRHPSLHVIIAPVPVQGAGAAPQIAEALRWLSDSRLVDVVIVGRGGGSWEDLWCFNEEPVVRAIAASRVPIVSAVGHETDYTLADFAADLRAPTPSAAAEAVAPVRGDLLDRIASLHGRARRAAEWRRLVCRQRLESCSHRLSRHRTRLQAEAQRVDEVAARLGQATRARLAAWRTHLGTVRERLQRRDPYVMLREARLVVPQIRKRLESVLRARAALRLQRVRALMGMLDDLSPLAVLRRGYSILSRASDGVVVTDASSVSVGEDVKATLALGRLLCSVKRVNPSPP
jgi:exodeoxyribonuclease VII large subunit